MNKKNAPHAKMLIIIVLMQSCCTVHTAFEAEQESHSTVHATSRADAQASIDVMPDHQPITEHLSHQPTGMVAKATDSLHTTSEEADAAFFRPVGKSDTQSRLSSLLQRTSAKFKKFKSEHVDPILEKFMRTNLPENSLNISQKMEQSLSALKKRIGATFEQLGDLFHKIGMRKVTERSYHEAAVAFGHGAAAYTLHGDLEAAAQVFEKAAHASWMLHDNRNAGNSYNASADAYHKLAERYTAENNDTEAQKALANEKRCRAAAGHAYYVAGNHSMLLAYRHGMYDREITTRTLFEAEDAYQKADEAFMKCDDSSAKMDMLLNRAVHYGDFALVLAKSNRTDIMSKNDVILLVRKAFQEYREYAATVGLKGDMQRYEQRTIDDIYLAFLDARTK